MTKMVFKGSYIDGCEKHIPTWCGLELTPEQEDSLWAVINETDLIEQAGGYVDVTESVDDAMPGMNDTYYSVFCENVKGFKASLREEIREIIGCGSSGDLIDD